MLQIFLFPRKIQFKPQSQWTQRRQIAYKKWFRNEKKTFETFLKAFSNLISSSCVHKSPFAFSFHPTTVQKVLMKTPLDYPLLITSQSNCFNEYLSLTQQVSSSSSVNKINIKVNFGLERWLRNKRDNRKNNFEAMYHSFLEMFCLWKEFFVDLWDLIFPNQ